MKVKTIKLHFKKRTKRAGIMDITRPIEHLVISSKADSGVALVYTNLPNAAMTIIEYEKGVVSDMLKSLSTIASKAVKVKGAASQKAKNIDILHAMLGSSVTIPVREGRLVLGKWQSIVLMDFNKWINTDMVVLQLILDGEPLTIETHEFTFDKPVEEPYFFDMTRRVKDIISKSKIGDGIANIFIGSTTVGIRIMRYDIDTKARLAGALEALAPSGADYMHHKLTSDMYGIGSDTNGKSHIRSAIFGPYATVPVIGRKIPLGENSIMAIDFDVIKRKRRVIVQIIGE